MIRGEARPTDVVVSIADQELVYPEDLIPLFDKYFRVKAPIGYLRARNRLGLPAVRLLWKTWRPYLALRAD